MSKKIPCVECGDAPVNHTLIKASVIISHEMRPFNKGMDKIMGSITNNVTEKLTPLFVWFMTLIHFGKMRKTYTEEGEHKDGGRTIVLWKEAIRRGIDMEELWLGNHPTELFIAKFNGEMRAFDSLPRPKGRNSESLAWMDDKEVMDQKFEEAGIPVAKGGDGIARTFSEALKIFKSVTPPVITKPNVGSRSRHTTIHINDEAALKRGFDTAKQLSPWVIIEEELEGFVFRGTVIGGEVAGIVRREPASVYGDGTHTVRELVDIENALPVRQGPIFHKIPTDKSAEDELTRQKKTWEYVPQKNEIVTLGDKASRGVGGGIVDVTDEAHPDNIELLRSVGRVLKDMIVGVDFIMKDITVSWKDQPRSGVIECNSAPFIDLHYFVLKGKPRNVAGNIWDIIFPKSHKD